jgi:hypothetical protein
MELQPPGRQQQRHHSLEPPGGKAALTSEDRAKHGLQVSPSTTAVVNLDCGLH